MRMVFCVIDQYTLLLLLLLQEMLVFEGIFSIDWVALLQVAEEKRVQADSVLNSIFVDGHPVSSLLQEDSKARVAVETLRREVLEIFCV